MANSARYGWRLPDATDKPVLHVDIPALASDIEDTLYKTPQLVAGFPKRCMDTDINVSGWRGYYLWIWKYKLADNLFKYEFTGYILRASQLTIPANAAQMSVANFLPADCVVSGITNATFMVAPLQGYGGLSAACQVLFTGRSFEVRASVATTIATSPASGSATPTSMGLSIANFIGYGTT